MFLNYGLVLGLCIQIRSHTELCEAQETIFVNSTYQLISQNFPSNYPDNHGRKIIFTTLDSHRVLLNFDFISTETRYDFVKVGNGNTTDEQVLLTWSGGPAENKTKVLSSGNTMWFSFETDETTADKGFSGVVQAVPAEIIIDCDSEFDCQNGVCIQKEYACNRNLMVCPNSFDEDGPCRETIFVNSTYQLISQNYPASPYREIIFRTFDSHRVLLIFDFISLNFAMFGNGDIINEQILLQWVAVSTGHKTKIVSAGNTMWFWFATFFSKTDEGFSGVVRAVPPETEIDCNSAEFDCKNGFCIPKEYACTTYPVSCSGIYDEDSPCRELFECVDSYDCLNGVCVPWTLACSQNQTFCGNKRDENGCPESCDLPDLSDGVLPIDFDGEMVNNGTLIGYSCRVGYILMSSANALCINGEWLPPKVPACEAFSTVGDKLLDIPNENVTLDVIQISAQTIEKATADESFVKENGERILLIIRSLESVVQAKDSSFKVTEPVIQTVSNLMNVNEGFIGRSPETTGRILAAFEQQLVNVQNTEENFTQTYENVDVSAVKINTSLVQRNLVFANILNTDRTLTLNGDLRESSSRIFSNDVDVHVNDTVVSISLPTTFLKTLHGVVNESEKVPVTFAVFSNSRLFVPLKTLKSGEDNTEGTITASKITERIASRIVFTKVKNDKVSSLHPELSVVTKFNTNLSIDIDGVIQDTHCVYWNKDDRGVGHWSEDGCKRMPDEAELTVCRCEKQRQLGSFAVLVRVRKESYKSEVPLYYITLVGSIISCACVVFCIITFVSLKNLRSKQPTHIHINLCVALLGFYISFLLSTMAVNKPTFCAISSAAVHFFVLSTAAWMSAEAINMYLLFVLKGQTKFRHFIRIACVIGYGCPALLAILVAVLDKNSNLVDDESVYCYIKPGFAFYFGFLAEVALLVVSNFVIFILIIRKMLCRPLMVTTTDEGAKRKEIVTRVRHGILFWFILGLSWIFGFAAAADTKTFIFHYLYCIFIALQGVVMFLLLCVANPEFRKAFGAYTAICVGSQSTSFTSAHTISASASASASKPQTGSEPKLHKHDIEA